MGWAWMDDGDGWKTKQRQTCKPRGERAATRAGQSSSARSQLSSSTPSTSSEANARFLGSSSLSDLPLRAPRLRAKAFCSMTGSTRSPTAGTVVRLLTRPQLRSIRSRTDRNYWSWQPGCGQWGDEHTAQRLEEIAPAPEQPNPTSPTRLLKAWNAAKNAVAQKANQHAAVVDKVARWSVELEKGQTDDAGPGRRAL